MGVIHAFQIVRMITNRATHYLSYSQIIVFLERLFFSLYFNHCDRKLVRYLFYHSNGEKDREITYGHVHKYQIHCAFQEN